MARGGRNNRHIGEMSGDWTFEIELSLLVGQECLQG